MLSHKKYKKNLKKQIKCKIFIISCEDFFVLLIIITIKYSSYKCKNYIKINFLYKVYSHAKNILNIYKKIYGRLVKRTLYKLHARQNNNGSCDIK